MDLTTGRAAAGVAVSLERKTHSAGWQALGSVITDINGAAVGLIPAGDVFLPGHYRLTFETGSYFLMRNLETFFQQVVINFTVKDASRDQEIPLLLSPFGYSTHRGN